jgi:hypothetical protein
LADFKKYLHKSGMTNREKQGRLTERQFKGREQENNERQALKDRL